MLVESSFSASVETTLLNTSEYQDPFAAFNWMSLAETYQMIHKLPEQSQASFLEAVPVPDAMNLDELEHPKIQESCPEQTTMNRVSESPLPSLVYSRRKRRPGGTEEHNPGECKKHDESPDDSIVPVYNPGESIKGKHRFNNCLVYSRKEKRDKTCCVTGETTLRADGIDDGQECGETKRRRTRFDNCLVYTSRKKVGVNSNSCSFSKHVSGGTKIHGDQAHSEEYNQRGHIVKADGPVYSQSKHFVKSNGSFTEFQIGETKRNGDTSDGLHVYSRRKQRGKSIGARVNGFLVYRRKKPKANCITDNTQATQGTSSSNGTNDSSDSDTDGSSSPFRRCKRCDKAGNVEKMLICDECEEAYHTRCCGVRMKEVAEIDDWFCRFCWKNSSKTKIKGRPRERKWRVTEPFVIGIRVGKEFQADVPDWSGPTMSDTSFVGEPLEIDQSKYMHDLKKTKNGKKPRSPVNWLQCREEDRNGDICGKWRRAPRSEVQTNDWECFCCVFWDPSHADCAVSQELETDEILKQLKYIKMLRPRSEAKTRKIGPNGQKQIT
ncbi:RING/FYVE/PHD zinc finger superfamily protein [Hirschfeldia incana]|nr:RING/FYVE/PHD zinc finger superfamily protein [Hirschfeldia incana]